MQSYRFRNLIICSTLHSPDAKLGSCKFERNLKLLAASLEVPVASQ